MDNNYFENLANSLREEEPAANTPSGETTASLTVKVDIDCKLFCDGDFLDFFEANKVKKITVQTGWHLFTIESAQFSEVTEDHEIDVTEAGKNYPLLVKGLKQKEDAMIQKAEENKRKAEEEAKRKAEIEAKRKAEEEEKRKMEEEEARRKAAEEERKRKELLREPYAALSNDNKTLTFYFDDQKTQRKGMSIGPFVLDEDNNGSTEWYIHRDGIIEVVFDESISQCNRIVSSALWFYNLNHLTNIKGLHFLNTENITDMYGMFAGCSSLKELDLSGFSTGNVTDMYGLFADCSSLKELDLSGFSTGKVTDMCGMFCGCTSLQMLDLRKFNTENVTDMSEMFKGCSSLQTLDLSGFNTKKVTDMKGMFDGCSSMRKVDLSSFKIKNVTNVSRMFAGCSSLKELDLRSFSNVTLLSIDNYQMFYGCPAEVTYKDLFGN